MKQILLNENEFEALAGEPLLQFKLYLVLRWVMDGKTRKVGLMSSISQAWLARELEVEAMPGRKLGNVSRPTRQAIRSALDGLERIGLIEPCGNGEVSVFLLPKASATFARPKQEQPRNNQGQQPRNNQRKPLLHSDYAAYPQGGATTPDAVGTTILSSKVNPLCQQAAATAIEQEGQRARVVDLLLPLSPLEVVEKLKAWERKRGCVAALSATDVNLLAWCDQSITEAELLDAYNLSVARRVQQRCASAINLGLVNVFVGDALNGRRVGRGGMAQRPAAALGGISRLGIEAERIASELSLERLEGESDADLMARVSFERDKRTSALKKRK